MVVDLEDLPHGGGDVGVGKRPVDDRHVPPEQITVGGAHVHSGIKKEKSNGAYRSNRGLSLHCWHLNEMELF